MPTKTKQYSASERLYIHRKYVSTPTSYDTSTVVPSYVSIDCERTGVSNPKWRSTIKSGGDATTPMSGYDAKVLRVRAFGLACGFNTGSGSSAVSYEEHVSGQTSYALAIPGHVTGTSMAQADNEALKSAYQRVQQTRVQFQGLTALGELAETIRLIRRPAKAISDLVDGYFGKLNALNRRIEARKRYGHKARDRRVLSKADVKKFTKGAGDAWLEVAFGIRPLLSDTRAAAEAIARFRNDSRRDQIVSYGKSEASSEGSVNDAPVSGGYTLVNHRWIDRTTASVRYKVALDYTRRADFGSAERLIGLLGFHPEDFVPQLYELIPWSFFLDYFTNVGDLVYAGCSSQSEVVYAIRTYRLATERSGTSTPSAPALTPPTGWVSSPEVGSFSTLRSSVSRTSAPALDLPTLAISLPGRFDPWANTLALWAADSFSLSGRHPLASRGGH